MYMIQSSEPLKCAVGLQLKKTSNMTLAIEVQRDFVLADAVNEPGKKFDVNKQIKV